jgi:ubiquinone/menaquinone biosynthesis C-methylase UbiE
MQTAHAPRRSVGALLHSPRLYDLTVWLALFGRERRCRERMLDLARLQPGECVLDVGCGTGTLAIGAKARVGACGTVYGIDASAPMIARARSKAGRAALEVQFETAAAQALPLADASIDVALASLMLHHLGRAARGDMARELQRVVARGGRVLVIDFVHSTRRHRGPFAHFSHGHGHVEQGEVGALLTEAGFRVSEQGAVGFQDMHFTLAVRMDRGSIRAAPSASATHC